MQPTQPETAPRLIQSEHNNNNNIMQKKTHKTQTTLKKLYCPDSKIACNMKNKILMSSPQIIKLQPSE